MLTGLTEHLPRKILFSTFFPSVLAVVVGMITLPTLREALQQPKGLGVVGETAELELAVLLVLILTALLFVANVPLVRLYEGYPWQDSWIGQWRIARHRRRLQDICAEEVVLGRMIRALLRRNPEDKRLPELRRRRDKLTRSRLDDFPKPVSVLPTRLGNVIRAFENYPARQYRMAGVELWPRLVPLLSKEVAASVDSAKSRFDLVVNASCLSFLLAVAGIVEVSLATAGSGAPFWGLMLAGASFVAGASFYRAAIVQAKSWARTVKAAFDLGRRDLLKSLGFDAPPKTLVEERRLWREVSLQLVDLDPWDGSPPALRFSGPSPPRRPKAVASDRQVAVEVTRGFQSREKERLGVVLRVSNSTGGPVKGIEVSDPLPAGWGYGWDTVATEGQPVEVRGTDPPCFLIPRLDHGESVEIRYERIRTS